MGRADPAPPGSRLRESNRQGSNLRGAHLQGADLWRSSLAGGRCRPSLSFTAFKKTSVSFCRVPIRSVIRDRLHKKTPRSGSGHEGQRANSGGSLRAREVREFGSRPNRATPPIACQPEVPAVSTFGHDVRDLDGAMTAEDFRDRDLPRLTCSAMKTSSRRPRPVPRCPPACGTWRGLLEDTWAPAG
jgi:hypothetical protein